MSAPDRIRINWNAADGYERFLECDIEASRSHRLTPEEITRVLANQKGRLFRLMGIVDEPAYFVTLEIEGETGPGLKFTNCTEPNFTAEYMVTDDPRPYISSQGNYVFELHTTAPAE